MDYKILSKAKGLIKTPTRREIDEHTGKLIVGLIALYLASFTEFLSGKTVITSISQSYHVDGWARDVFVGFLFAISAFLLSYNGHSKKQMVLSKVAALAALGVALFPCGCDEHIEIIPGIHGLSAAIMFLILAVFCYFFFDRAWNKGHLEARLRAIIYAICGVVIVASILVIATDILTDGTFSSRIPRLVFYGERTALIAFGIAWLIASRALPWITTNKERTLHFGGGTAAAASG